VVKRDEYLTLKARCRISRCRYKRVRLYLYEITLQILCSDFPYIFEKKTCRGHIKMGSHQAVYKVLILPLNYSIFGRVRLANCILDYSNAWRLPLS